MAADDDAAAEAVAATLLAVLGLAQAGVIAKAAYYLMRLRRELVCHRQAVFPVSLHLTLGGVASLLLQA